MEQQDSRGLKLNLERFGAAGGDEPHIASVVVSTWTDITEAIAPVIGARGVVALYKRSLYLARSQHPWMVPVQEDADMETALAALQTLLMNQESSTAAAGGAAHLQIFYVVLSSLIGSSLSDSLLRSIWENSTNGPAGLDISR